MNKELIKKYKISKFYKYQENVDKDSKIYFGWIVADDVDSPTIISYESKSKKVTEAEAKWSKKEGANATSLKDYRLFFEALVKDTPEQILETWKDDISGFSNHWESLKENHTLAQGEILIRIAKLIVTRKKFSLAGRIYKIV